MKKPVLILLLLICSTVVFAGNPKGISLPEGKSAAVVVYNDKYAKVPVFFAVNHQDSFLIEPKTYIIVEMEPKSRNVIYSATISVALVNFSDKSVNQPNGFFKFDLNPNDVYFLEVNKGGYIKEISVENFLEISGEMKGLKAIAGVENEK